MPSPGKVMGNGELVIGNQSPITNYPLVVAVNPKSKIQNPKSIGLSVKLR
jgi:hypothetical protein